MTDKQIKDGIDISQCKYYSIKYNCCNHTISGSCIKENCQIFRLLQTIRAKEQECEELKEQLTILNDEDVVVEITVEQFEEYKKLKAENEELTIINARLLGRLEVDEIDTSLVFNLDKELRQKEKEFYTAIQKVVKLKQTLTEIKEIAEHCIKQDICTTCDNSEKCHIEDEEIPTYDVCKLILQKISECEVE